MNIVIADDSYEAAWQDFVSDSETASPYHQWGWLKSVKSAYGFNVYPLMAFDDEHKVVGVLPLANIKRPMANGKMSSLPYCDIGGAVSEEKKIEKALVEFAINLANEKNIKHIEYRINAQEEDNQNVEAFDKVRMILPLPESSELLMKGFKSKLRSQIRKAEKKWLNRFLGY